MSKEKELKRMYLHDTNTIWARDGELHLMNENNYLVINIRNLYFDLSHILYLTKNNIWNFFTSIWRVFITIFGNRKICCFCYSPQIDLI